MRYLVSIGKRVMRLSCLRCSFTGSLRPLGNIREENRACGDIIRESLERSSVRILSRRYRKAKNTIMKIIHRATSMLPTSMDIQKRLLPRWSGILVVDGKVIRVYDKLSTKLKHSSLSEDELKWMNKMRWLCGIDHETGDLPQFSFKRPKRQRFRSSDRQSRSTPDSMEKILDG